MAKAKLNIRSLSTTEKVAKARQIIEALTDNAAFTTPQPPLATIATATPMNSKRPTAKRKPPDRPP